MQISILCNSTAHCISSGQIHIADGFHKQKKGQNTRGRAALSGGASYAERLTFRAPATDTKLSHPTMSTPCPRGRGTLQAAVVIMAAAVIRSAIVCVSHDEVSKDCRFFSCATNLLPSSHCSSGHLRENGLCTQCNTCACSNTCVSGLGPIGLGSKRRYCRLRHLTRKRTTTSSFPWTPRRKSIVHGSTIRCHPPGFVYTPPGCTMPNFCYKMSR